VLQKKNFRRSVYVIHLLDAISCVCVCQFLGIVIIVFIIQVVIGIVAFVCREQVRLSLIAAFYFPLLIEY